MVQEGGKFLSQREIDSLLSSIDQGEVEVGAQEEHAKKVVPYDFKRPERVARDQLRAIETLHEVFCRNTQAAVSGWLRSVLDLGVVSIDQLTYSEFINSLPNPTCFNVLSCEPLEGNFIVEINPTVAFPIIERLLGSGKAIATPPERALTDLEWKLVERIITRIITGLQDVWTSVAPIILKITGRESNPQLVPIMPPNEPVIAVKLEFSMGEYKGHINICIPVVSIEGVMDKLSTHTWFVKKKDKGDIRHERITETLSAAKLTVSTFLNEHIVKLGDLKSLQVGDIILTNHKEEDPLVVCIENRPKYDGIPGSIKDKKAVRILHKISRKEMVTSEAKGYVEILKASKPESATGQSGEAGGVSDSIMKNIVSTRTTCSVLLAEKTVHMNDVLNLKQGTIIEFNDNIREPLAMEIGNVKLARGLIVKMGERFGFQVVDFILNK